MTEYFSQFDNLTFLGVSLTNIGLAVAVSLGSYLIISVVLRFAIGRMRKITARTANHFDDSLVEVIAATNRIFLVLASVLIGVSMLDLSDRWNSRVSHLWFIALAMQLGVWLTRAITVGLKRYQELHSTAGMTQVSASATLLSWSLRTLLWATVLLAVLSNLGVNITAFVASLGVGGIAIALAVQNVLGDLFASLSIAVDKPFEVGDFIAFDSNLGSVQYIGLKTTRIRSLSGEQIIVGNTDLLKQVVKNYKRMAERRIVFKFGITYDATPEQAEAVPGIVKRLIGERDKLRLDRAHFQGFGDSSLDFEVVYYVKDPDFGLYMDEQQRLNLQLMRELSAIGVDFAFPTRTVHIATVPEAVERGMSEPAGRPEQNRENGQDGQNGQRLESARSPAGLQAGQPGAA
ncbi:MAG: mechanosensitive ion channel family protein [Gammaproteobacteria bacterium]|nr:mechanosensitive ion channel family protein [Gammaproteobacteria bacterium]MBU1443406.1 mechanosensitive ion channel family protein [Gammaproteobacteria bacterium]MBU2286778.1 mechanosensitive ion channel family protein [Gammaproteobacteria bacterium]